jgi:arylsulfatase A-like enzyme
LGIAEDTLVVFCSDNGPVLDDGYADGAVEKVGAHRSAGVFSGGKYSVYEGGTLTPFITRWTGRIEPGQASDEMVCTIDLAASLAGMTGVALPQDGCLDSFDVMGALLGEEGAKGRASLIQQDNGKGGNYGFREGDWKLQRHDSKKTRNMVVEKQLENTPVPQFQLFDLKDDPAEEKNVIEEHPDVAERMEAELEGLIEAGRSRP